MENPLFSAISASRGRPLVFLQGNAGAFSGSRFEVCDVMDLGRAVEDILQAVACLLRGGFEAFAIVFDLHAE